MIEFRQLAAGLSQALKAVAAALQFPFGNGQAEGQVNLLKLIKRKMLGRANFDLYANEFCAAGPLTHFTNSKGEPEVATSNRG